MTLKEKILIPEGTQIEINNNLIKVEANGNSLSRKIKDSRLLANKQGNEIVLESKKQNKNSKKLLFTFRSHIKNMIQGVNSKFLYKLKICSSHFPMAVKIEGREVVISNFLGEKIPRRAKILDDVTVSIKGKEIYVESSDKEAAGQTSANIENSTRITKRDRRIFQDGIWITSKGELNES